MFSENAQSFPLKLFFHFNHLGMGVHRSLRWCTHRNCTHSNVWRVMVLMCWKLMRLIIILGILRLSNFKWFQLLNWKCINCWFLNFQFLLFSFIFLFIHLLFCFIRLFLFLIHLFRFFLYEASLPSDFISSHVSSVCGSPRNVGYNYIFPSRNSYPYNASI